MTTVRISPAQMLQLETSKPGVWRHEVLDRVGRLEAELQENRGSGDATTVGTVEENLRGAREIGADGNAWFGTGRQIENAWRHLRLAEEALLKLIPKTDESRVKAAATKALAHAKRDLPADNPIAKDLTAALGAATIDPVLVLRLTQDLTIAAHESRTAQHVSQRAFRDQIRVLTGVLFVIAGLSVLVLHFAPNGGPSGLLPAPEGLKTWAVVFLAMLAGSMGALFSAVPSLSQIPDQSSPFTSVKDQAALKVAVGAWSAVVGLLVVNAGMAPAGQPDAASQASTLAGFAIMSAFFGASQEALTRFADHKAANVTPPQ